MELLSEGCKDDSSDSSKKNFVVSNRQCTPFDDEVHIDHVNRVDEEYIATDVGSKEHLKVSNDLLDTISVASNMNDEVDTSHPQLRKPLQGYFTKWNEILDKYSYYCSLRGTSKESVILSTTLSLTNNKYDEEKSKILEQIQNEFAIAISRNEIKIQSI